MSPSAPQAALDGAAATDDQEEPRIGRIRFIVGWAQKGPLAEVTLVFVP